MPSVQKEYRGRMRPTPDHDGHLYMFEIVDGPDGTIHRTDCRSATFEFNDETWRRFYTLEETIVSAFVQYRRVSKCRDCGTLGRLGWR